MSEWPGTRHDSPAECIAARCRVCFDGLSALAEQQPIARERGVWDDDQTRKADAGKRRWDLVPWRELGQVVDVLTYGAAKYGERTWQGVTPHRYEAALMRHFAAWSEGEQRDAESGLHHLAHVAVNALFLLYSDRRAP